MAVIYKFPPKGVPVKEETEVEQRSFKCAPEVWDAFDEDARQSKRSASKHLEWLLTRLYQLEENRELSEEDFAAARPAYSERRKRA